MLVQNTYNRKITEYNRIDDIHEDAIKLNKLNSTSLERHLLQLHRRNDRRTRKNHAQRLAQWKISNDNAIK